MRRYRVDYISKTGQRASLVLEAISTDEALEKASRMPEVDIVLGVRYIWLDFSSWIKRTYKIPLKTLVFLCRQFALMFRAGMTVLEMFDILISTTSDRNLKRLLSEMREEIRAGKSFSKVFETRAHVFGELFVNMVKVGEASGVMDEVFARLHNYFSRMHQLRVKIITLLIYPILVTVTAVIVLNIALFFVIPRFEKLFRGLMPLSELPLITRILFKLSYIARTYWHYGILGSIVIGFSFWLILRTANLRKTLENLILKVPLIGTTLKFYYCTIFFSTLALMMRTAMPIIPALKMSANSTDSKFFTAKLNRAIEELQTGKSLSKALVELKLFEPIVEQFLITGERTGSLYDMLEQAFEYYNTEVDVLLERTMRMLEPILIVILGFFVFLLLLGLYLPIFMLPGKIASS